MKLCKQADGKLHEDFCPRCGSPTQMARMRLNGLKSHYLTQHQSPSQHHKYLIILRQKLKIVVSSYRGSFRPAVPRQICYLLVCSPQKHTTGTAFVFSTNSYETKKEKSLLKSEFSALQQKNIQISIITLYTIHAKNSNITFPRFPNQKLLVVWEAIL